jgi:TetR/AcrR family transcriptional repressor of nem operon
MKVNNIKELILKSAKQTAQSHGYNGLNFRELASMVGIKAPTIYHYFPTKADLGAAVAKRYWEETAEELEEMLKKFADPRECLRRYSQIFRRSLEDGNRLCLGSFMSAEHDDLPEEVKAEVQAFADINIAWLARVLAAAEGTEATVSQKRAQAIFAAVAGAQLMARSRSKISIFDDLMDSYRAAGLLPA